MTKHTLKSEDLAQFIGTENHWMHGLVRSVSYTDGVKYVADNGGAYWLLDILATMQSDKRIAAEGFQHWVLKVDQANNSAVLTCDDGNGNIVYTQAIPFTDFPLPEIAFYVTEKVIMLPSEY